MKNMFSVDVSGNAQSNKAQRALFRLSAAISVSLARIMK